MSRSSLGLPADLASVREARRFVAECVAPTHRAEVVETAQLLVSELVTNAVAHAGTRVEVECTPTERGLRVSVRDGSSHVPRPGRPGAWDEQGRGLVLVETLASRWGAERDPGNGKAVWFELGDQ
ncbi:MAG TPA: ATP-binding protein [Acidimicrobiales bacterium]|nr:ATP-binding protein [Acidimicrobiales bacterium]